MIPRRRLDGRVVYILALGAIAALGFWIRYQLWIVFGGLEHSYVAWAKQNYYGGIVDAYISGARSLRAGNGWPWLAYSPGYALFLLAWRLVGVDTYQRVRLAQAALDCLTIVPLGYLVTRATGRRWVALGAALVCAIAPRWAFGSIMLLAESFSPALVCWILAAIVWARSGTTTLRWVLPAALVGLSALIRPDLTLLVIPVAAFAALHAGARRRLLPVALVLACVSAPVVANAVYQRAQNGRLVLLSSNGGYALWSGLGQRPNRFGYFVDDSRAAELLRSAHIHDRNRPDGDLQSAAADRYFRRQYTRAWQHHPAYVLGTIAWRVTYIPVAAAETGRIVYGAWLTGPLRFGLLALVPGVAILLRRRSYAWAAIVALPLVYAVTTLGLVYVEDRYVRYVALSYLLGAAVVVGAVADALRRRVRLPPTLARASSAFALVIVVAGVAATTWPLGRAVGDARVSTKAVQALRSGRLQPEADLAAGGWERSTGAMVTWLPAQHRLSVASIPGGSQIRAGVRVPRDATVLFEYGVELHDVGAFVAVFGPRSKLLASQTFSGIGGHAGLLSVRVHRPTSLTLVVSNFGSDNGSSAFDVTQLNEYLYAPSSRRT